jgi:hypothetical protein
MQRLVDQAWPGEEREEVARTRCVVTKAMPTLVIEQLMPLTLQQPSRDHGHRLRCQLQVAADPALDETLEDLILQQVESRLLVEIVLPGADSLAREIGGESCGRWKVAAEV